MLDKVYVITAREPFSNNDERFIVQAFIKEEDAIKFIEKHEDELVYKDLDYEEVDVY